MKFIWRKVLKVDTKTKRSFNGASVYKLLSGASGQYVLFYAVSRFQQLAEDEALNFKLGK